MTWVTKVMTTIRNRSSEASGLDREAAELFALQTVRNPMREQMLSLARRFAALSQGDRGFDGHALLMQAKIYDQIAEPGLALAALVLVMKDGSMAARRRAANQTLEIVRKLGTKKYARQIEDAASRLSTINTLGTIVTDSRDLEIGRRIDIYVSLFKRETRDALRKSYANLKETGKEVVDFVYVITNILFRSDSQDYLEEISTMVRDVTPLLKKGGHYAFLAGIRVQNGGSLAKSGLLEPLTFSEIKTILAEASVEEIRSLTNDKAIFLFRYKDCEPIKLAILESFRRRVLLANPNSRNAKRYLDKLAQTERFWSDQPFRDGALSELSLMAKMENTSEAFMILGTAALLRHDLKSAKVNFDRSIVEGTQFAETGATSYFIDLGPEDEKDFTNVETSFENVVRTDLAYVCCADIRYFQRYADIYLSSLRQTGSNHRVHFHIAASSHSEARALATKVLTGSDNVSFSSEVPKLNVPTYYASMRFLRGPEFLRSVAPRIFLTDIDVVFRKNPDQFVMSEAWDQADVGFRIYDRVRIVKQGSAPHSQIMRYPRLLPWSQVNAACVAILDTERGRNTAEKIARDMRRHLGRALSKRSSAWWVDQNSLLQTLLELRAEGKTRIVNIEDVGLPYGSFSYEASFSVPGVNPIFAEAK